MVTELRRYVVKNLKHPIKEDLSRDIEWICNCLGFADSRDKERTASKIFKLLVDAAKEGNGLTSEEIAESVKPTRGAVVHHLNKCAGPSVIHGVLPRSAGNQVNHRRAIFKKGDIGILLRTGARYYFLDQ